MTIIMPRFDGNAACAETDPDAWFPETGAEGQIVTLQARTICGRCEIRTACLQWALENDESGTWGGLTERQRQRLPGRRPSIEADTINHGTEAGEKQHRRRAEKPCMECRDAANLARSIRFGRLSG